MVYGKVCDFEAAISLTGYGWYNVGILMTNALSLMCVILETMGIGFIIPAAQCDLDLSLNDKGLISAAGFLGIVSSSIFWGFLADTKGRKKVIRTAMFIAFMFNILSSLAPEKISFGILRYLNGFFVGGGSAVIYAYVGEFHSNRHRARVVTLMTLAVAVGSMLMPGLAWLVLDGSWTLFGTYFKPWRLLIILYGLSGFISAISLIFAPESPKYLLVIGEKNKALEILQNMYKMNTGKPIDTYPVTEILAEETSNQRDGKLKVESGKSLLGIISKIWSQIVPLFQRKLILRTLVACVLQWGCFAGPSGFFLWFPESLLRMKNYENDVRADGGLCDALMYRSTNETEEVVSTCKTTLNEDVFVASLSIGGVICCGYIIITLVVNSIRNTWLLAIVLIFPAIAAIMIPLMNGFIFVTTAYAAFLLSCTSIAVTNTVVVDIFPTCYRGMAMSISMMCGRTGAVVATHLVGYLLTYHCSLAFDIAASLQIVIAIIGLLIPTKSWKSS